MSSARIKRPSRVDLEDDSTKRKMDENPGRKNQVENCWQILNRLGSEEHRTPDDELRRLDEELYHSFPSPAESVPNYTPVERNGKEWEEEGAT